jgi:hypothetical protein
MSKDDTTPWTKASASDAQGQCVEIRRHADMIEVRDSKDAGAGPILRSRSDEFAAWLTGAKNAEFDHLL